MRSLDSHHLCEGWWIFGRHLQHGIMYAVKVVVGDTILVQCHETTEAAVWLNHVNVFDNGDDIARGSNYAGAYYWREIAYMLASITYSVNKKVLTLLCYSGYIFLHIFFVDCIGESKLHNARLKVKIDVGLQVSVRF